MDKYQELLKKKEKTLAKLKIVGERRKQEKDGEDAWPGHGESGYFEDENEYDLLKQYLRDIEEEIRKLEKK